MNSKEIPQAGSADSLKTAADEVRQEILRKAIFDLPFTRYGRPSAKPSSVLWRICKILHN